MSEFFTEGLRKSLEDAFFQKRDDELLAKMRADKEREDKIAELSRETGVTDRAVLERLVSLGLDASIVIPLVIVPWLEVAWADGALDAKERAAILQHVDKAQIPPGSVADRMLRQWLDQQPPKEMFATWTSYVKGMMKGMSELDRRWMRERILRRATEVAHASGGIFNLILRTSKAEKDAIRRIEAAFED